MTELSDQISIGALIIGDEILSGRRQDRHFDQVIMQLEKMGLEPSWINYLGDDEALLVDSFRHIKQRGDVCFSFGGIGATPDDRTRQSVASAFDVELYRHPDAVAIIEQRYGEAAYPKRILMAELPLGSEIIPNPYNQIPGFSMDRIHCLPGFPEMAWPMMEWLLKEKYSKLGREKSILFKLLIQGVRESELIEPMEQVQLLFPDVKISSLPRFLEDGGYQVEMGVKGIPRDAEKALYQLHDQLRARQIVFKDISNQH